MAVDQESILFFVMGIIIVEKIEVEVGLKTEVVEVDVVVG